MNAAIVTYGILAVLLVVAVVAMVLAILRGRALRVELGEDEALLDELRGGPGGRPLVRAIRGHVVGADPSSGRFVLGRSLEALRRDYVEETLSQHWAFWSGGALTGVALICTFLLIALVMTGDVGAAVRESASAGSDGASHLSDAVEALGGKFFISAAGVAGSVLLLITSNLVRARTLRAADHPTPELGACFATLEAHQWQLRLAELEDLRAERAAAADRHAESRALLASLDARIEKLHSIEVSVKAIGNEVSANLKHVMKDAMGEQLRALLTDTMVVVDQIATRVQESLSDSFGRQLAQLAEGMSQALAGLQRAVEGQGQLQLEKILAQLQNTVSGGFQAESQRMMTVLERFASAVPELQHQLTEMTGKLAEESSGLVGQVLSASRTEIEAIVRELRNAAESSASRYEAIDTQAAAAGLAVSQASEALATSARSLLETASQTAAVLEQARVGSEASQAASRNFLAAGSAMTEAAAQVKLVVEASRVQTAEQQALLLRQRDYTKEVEKLWPELFHVYLTQFKASADEMGRSWESFHQQVAKVSQSVGSEFVESTGVLSDAVDRLVKIHAGNRAPA